MDTRNQNLLLPITEIHYLFNEEVTSVQNADDSHHKLITYNGSWKKIYFTPGTSSFVEPPKQTKSGMLYTQKVTASIPGNDEDNISTISELEKRPCLFRLTFKNGLQILIGSITLLAYAELDLQINTRAGYNLTITCQMPYRAPYVSE